MSRPQDKLEQVPAKISFPEEESKSLAYWDEIKAFETSLELNKDKPVFSFYDGPPFATGMPHYGHLLAGTIKDTVTRFAHMTGHHVPRRWGWDCHGLPVEYEIDQKLGIKSSADVMEMGIDKYNAECRSIVMRYAGEWKRVVNRVGRWIDMENDYKTLNIEFMESVWWVFRQLFDKDLVYRGYKVMPFSTACGTPLSNFEANLNYKEVSDPAITVAFPLVDEPDVFLLAWTTTPWTLPSNLALCVHPEMEYVKIKELKGGRTVIVLGSRLSALFKKKTDYEVLDKFPGSQLKGKQYVPVFPYFKERAEQGSFRVLNDNYVTDGSGTGVVHQAPAFGEDDYRVCLENGVIAKGETVPCPVDSAGCFTSEVFDFKGRYVKEADKDLTQMIKDSGRLYEKSSVVHQYPFCWRSDTPLIYKAVPSWFVRVESIKDRIIANNLKTAWVPAAVGEKRFHNWLQEAKDWAVSRNRFWGTPLPIWVSEDWEEIVCIGSVAELEELSGKNITDIHRDSIDCITIPSKKGKGTLKRIDEVFDCWFESGSMPYAQKHYPFENQSDFEGQFPADFIAEGLDQTRGWFYTLMVLSTALFDKPAFKNLVCNGLVLAEDGKKMSKRLRNYPDPEVLLNSHGADALRLYLINSPVVRAEPLKFKEAGVRDVVKDIFLKIYNALRLFVQCAKTMEVPFVLPESNGVLQSSNTLDMWIQASMADLLAYIHKEMAAYRLYTVVPRLLDFVEDLCNWYLRLNKSRIKGNEGEQEQLKCLQVTYRVLQDVTVALGPFTPFLAEWMYQRLRPMLSDPDAINNRSVHFQDFPKPLEAALDATLVSKVKRMQDFIENVRNLRDKRKVSLRNPVRRVTFVHREAAVRNAMKEMEGIIRDEVNCLELVVEAQDESLQLTANPNWRVLGAKLGKAMKPVSAKIRALKSEDLEAMLESGSVEVEGHTLTTDELQVQLKYVGKSKDLDAAAFGGGACMVDFKSDQELVDMGICRELTSRVQRLRKESGLLPGDQVEVVLTTEGQAAVALQKRMADFIKTIGVAPISTDEAAQFSDWHILGECNEVVAESKVQIRLLRASLLVPVPPSGFSAAEVKACIGPLDYNSACKQLRQNGKLVFQLDGRQDMALTLGKDVFLNAGDAISRTADA